MVLVVLYMELKEGVWEREEAWGVRGRKKFGIRRCIWTISAMGE